MIDYNTTRNKLVISEYGRNTQKMIEYIVTIEDREQRTNACNVIINVMAQMNAHVKETVDFEQKLWDHLHIISGFSLDVDSPYPVPSKQEIEARPERIPYQENNIKYKHYGKNTENIIEKAIELEDGPEKEAFIQTIANHLKKSYLNWNRDSVNDELIIQHLEVLSGGKLKLPENFRLISTGDVVPRPVSKKKKFVGRRPAKESYSNGGGFKPKHRTNPT
ncbi:MAG: DUF4290 domain-containing protein [Bacteroidetes bacterium]|nr:DUF4290 domain-containing protein [Bacteroidota bacterium]